MGSEMCIRDSAGFATCATTFREDLAEGDFDWHRAEVHGLCVGVCLLYTSDAADERSSVDLGGRRIIKKNN